MGGLGTTEILIIAAVLILLFGAKKLPDLARGSGRALRIFKSETKGLMADDDKTDPHGRPMPPGAIAASDSDTDALAAEAPPTDARPTNAQNGRPAQDTARRDSQL